MYFNVFPYIQYLFQDGKVRNVKNTSIRPTVVDELLGTPSNLENYRIREGESPDILAHLLYGDITMHWIILLANKINNPYKEWPKDGALFRKYIYDKYRTQTSVSGIEVTLTDDEVLEVVEFAGAPTNNYMGTVTNTETGEIVSLQPKHFVDASGNIYSYDSLYANRDADGRGVDVPTLTPVSYYEYEDNLNESRRNIVVPTQKIANRIKKELAGVVNGR